MAEESDELRMHDEEAAMLSKPAETFSVTAGGRGNVHNWEGGLLKCCGQCDAVGWGSCLLADVCPCIAFGLNMKRAFSSSAVLNGLLFGVLMVLAYMQHAFAIWELAEGCPPYHNADLPRTGTCQRLFEWKISIYLAMLLYFMALVFYVANRRTQMREKFGIPGSKLGDFCAWCWCGGCALCQETRTLWQNNVQEGVWYGRTVNVAVSDEETLAPMVQRMDDNRDWNTAHKS